MSRWSRKGQWPAWRCARFAGGATRMNPETVDRALLLARCEIAEAFFRGGDLLALELLASSSLRLYGHVIAGEIAALDLFDDLQECAAHLGIADRAQDDVQAALAYGPRAYAEIARAAA